MSYVVSIDTTELSITPIFKYIEVEDVPKSEAAGHKVMKQLEVVEARIAGNNSFSPVYPVDSFWRREGHQVITYAERWADQYRQFKEGLPAEALGTPLEMLVPFGASPAQLSLCRTMKIYSIEALANLEGQNLKNLGMNANILKEMARRFVAERQTRGLQADEVSALKARIAELEARSTQVPEADPTPDEMAEAVRVADDEYTGKSDSDLKDMIAERTGARPRGNPSRETLVQMLSEV